MFQQALKAPGEVVKQLGRNPIMFGLGALGGSTVLNQAWGQYGLPNQQLFTVDKMTITAADVGQALVGAAIAGWGDKIPVVGKFIGKGGAAAIGAGVMGGVGYSKLAQEFGLPQLPSSFRANAVTPFGQQPFSQAYRSGFRSFTGDIIVA